MDTIDEDLVHVLVVVAAAVDGVTDKLTCANRRLKKSKDDAMVFVAFVVVVVVVDDDDCTVDTVCCSSSFIKEREAQVSLLQMCAIKNNILRKRYSE